MVILWVVSSAFARQCSFHTPTSAFARQCGFHTPTSAFARQCGFHTPTSAFARQCGFHTPICIIPPSPSCLKLCAFEWLQSSNYWLVAVFNKSSPPKGPPTSSLRSISSGFTSPPLHNDHPLIPLHLRLAHLNQVLPPAFAQQPPPGQMVFPP
jgi:hypothetical protein